MFDPADVGIAEFTNPNYLSGDTIFQEFALPRQSQLGTPFFELDEGKFGRYWPKMAGSGGAVEVEHFVAEGVLYDSLAAAMADPPPAGWTLNSRVSQDYALDLIPRAVGYSAALIDYFFRGRLDVDIVDNAEAGEPSQLRIVGTNASEEALVSGGLVLLADDLSGTRKRLEPVSGTSDDLVIRDIGPGNDLVSTWFKATEPSERFVAVYQGALGDEPAAPAPGAVIGKVIGGVRVEQVFADGDHWKIRTPAGVFTLPLTTAEYQEVKWGNGADVLVARTAFGDGMPNRFASFSVLRPNGSIDLATDPTSGVVIVGELATAEFPFGVPLTAVTFNQTIHYRQRLGRVNPVRYHLRWSGAGMIYDAGGTETVPPAIDEVSTRDFTFSDAFTVALDEAHNLQFNAFGAERYLWDVFSVTADANGRLFAIINVQLFAPPGAQTTDFLGINHVTGELEKQATAYIQPFMPVDVGPIWVLLDLESTQIAASSVGSAIAIVSEARAEAPPFADPSYVRLEGFGPFHTAGMWAKPFEIYEDGPLGGVVAEGFWSVTAPIEVREDLGTLVIRAVVESTVGVGTVGASGLRRDDLAAAAPIATDVTTVETSRDMTYLQVGADRQDGIRIVTSDGLVPAPTQLFDVRPAGGAGVPKLVLLALDSEARGGATHVITWDPEARRAAVVATLNPGAHGLTGTTSSTALVNSYLGPESEPAAFVVPLNDPRPPLAFLGESMWSFTMLEPNYLFNAENAKFYRLKAPLQRTALPAPLAGSADPSGDFHAVKLP